jgi:outer membrane protein OmpA-like peptidoglycan-associated protein
MNRDVFVLSVSLFAWITLCCFWYTCRIKGEAFSAQTAVITETQLFANNLPKQIETVSETQIPNSEDELNETNIDFALASENSDLKKEKVIAAPLVKKPIKTVSKVPCPAVLLAADKPIINDIIFREASSQIVCTNTLSQYAQALKIYLEENKGIIEIIGHTDNSQKSINNFTLGLERALSVKLFLIKEGIPAEKITTNSRADKDPVADNGSDFGRQQNRRVTIKIK